MTTIPTQGTVLIDFMAQWCGPCHGMLPIIDAIASERPDVTIVKVDVDEAGDIAAQYGVMSVPTFVVVRDGVVIAKETGRMPKEKLIAMISE